MSENCIFCDLIKNNTAHRVNAGVYRIVPLNPVTKGHVLFVSETHSRNASEIPIITGVVFQVASAWAGASAEDYNLITSVGTNATQTVHHLHVHYVPRTENDGLTLPWTGQVKDE